MARRFPPHPSHSPVPARIWDELSATCTDLRRLGFDRLADDMAMPPAPVIDLDAERRARRAS